jgi:hypothetical protein
MATATITAADPAKPYAKATARYPIGPQSSTMPSSHDSPIDVCHEQRFMAIDVELEDYSMLLDDMDGSISKRKTCHCQAVQDTKSVHEGHV